MTRIAMLKPIVNLTAGCFPLLVMLWAYAETMT